LIVVENGPELRDVLAGSLGVTVEVEKLRVIYLHDNVRIHLDDVKGLGRFLEFEAIVNDSCDEGHAQAKLEQLRRIFEISDDAILSQSYSDLTIAGERP
jgi:predicted adenylyl cyclase CyaB